MVSTKLEYTPLEEIPKIHATLNASFASGKLKSIEYRKYQLLQLLYLLQDNQERFEEALFSDMGRPVAEAQFFDLRPAIADAIEAYQSVDKWARPEKAPFHMSFFAMRPTIRKEPKGTALIIGPFNYPVWTVLGPFASAIAAGCTAVVKPSEQTPATSALMSELFAKYLDPDLYRIINGSIAETTELLKLPWGHLMYTGSTRVGKVIATAAAQTLTPITLELGGKSPVFIDSKTDLAAAAKRILWAKVVNAGQTCIAPDYVLVPRESQEKLAEEFKKAYAEFYPESAPVTKPGVYARLISPAAYTRLTGVLDGTKGTIVVGGSRDEATRFLEPAIVKDVSFDDSLMAEELFGPILPLVPVGDLDEALKFVNSRGHPLSLYVFTPNAAFKEKVFSNTMSGSAVANEQLLQAGVYGLPFGGIGNSGTSGYHTGKFGFDLFTHYRSTLDSPTWIDRVLGFRYPPYNDKKLANLKFMLGPLRLPPRPKGPPALTTQNSLWWLFALALAVTGGLMGWFRTIKA